MKINYDVKALPERAPLRGKPCEEVLAVIAFLATQKKNMVIEYDDVGACKRRYETIKTYRRTNKLQDVFDTYRSGNQIVVIKTKKPGRSTASAND
jgi:hypothetical protein